MDVYTITHAIEPVVGMIVFLMVLIRGWGDNIEM